MLFSCKGFAQTGAMPLNLLQARDIKLFRGGRELFGNAENLNLASGQSLLILGPSGCGKTSLLHVLAGLLPVSSGEILFRGQSYRSLEAHRLDRIRAESFGFVFQSLHLVRHLTVSQNIALAFSSAYKSPDLPSISRVCEALGLKGKEKQKAYSLSQGEAQRVCLARACVHSPKIVFADELTSALDDVNTKAVMDFLFELSKASGASLIVSTHDQRIKPYFKNILEMSI